MTTVPVYINIVFEDQLSAVIIERLLENSSIPWMVHRRIPGNGSGYIRRRISVYQEAARIVPFFILMDSDKDDCALTVLDSLIPREKRQPHCLFRIAVREVEAWLLADAKGISKFIGISEAVVNKTPETLLDAKGHLLAIARRSRKRDIREGLLPDVSTGAIIGPEYNQLLSVFVKQNWDIRAAAKRSESLRRAIRAIGAFRS